MPAAIWKQVFQKFLSEALADQLHQHVATQ